jgi:hypothetical protein
VDWNSGERQARSFERERAKLWQERERLNRVDERIRRDTGRTGHPRSWNGTSRGDETSRKPWVACTNRSGNRGFPPRSWRKSRALSAVATMASLSICSPRSGRLKEAREASEHGEPHLSDEQRKRLERVEDAATRFLKACGDPVATKRLIGGWVAGNLLHGESFEELVRGVAEVRMEVSMRLHQDKPRPAKRPVDEAFITFARDVVLALQDAGIDVKCYRDGKAARLLALLSASASEQVPIDRFRLVKRAISDADRLRVQRRRHEKTWEAVHRTRPKGETWKRCSNSVALT